MLEENINVITKELKGKKIINTKKLSDGYHTFEDLYTQRLFLSAALAKLKPNSCYIALAHADGSMFDDMFLIVFNTKEGLYSYHYHLRDLDLFKGVKVLEKEVIPYDGHTSSDVGRLMFLEDFRWGD